MVLAFIRLFIPPVGITLGIYFFSDLIQGFREALLYFSLAFFFNWLADRFIVERLIPKDKTKK